MSECRGQMPITPPQVRFPINGPSFNNLKPCEKNVAIGAAYSFVIATIGPATESTG